MNRHSLFTRVTELVLLLLFSIPALSPLFTTTPTASADGLLHLYRLVQLDALWQHGVFFSRWLPDLAYGYGIPLFNYYAPLVYYLTTPLHLLGIPFTLALNLSLAAALYVGAVGMFYFARALLLTTSASSFILHPKPSFGESSFLPALIAAVAYLYSPYLLFNALHRANLAEQWALAFAPFALWRFYQLTQTPTARNWVYAVLTFAAVMLSHNVTTFLFAPLLFFFTLVSLFSNSFRSMLTTPRSTLLERSSSVLRHPSFVVLFAFLFAITLSAFFWLPALLERDFVQISRVIVSPDFDYRFNFVSPTELISFLPRADTGRMNPSFPSTLGVIQILGVIAGIVVLVRNFRTRRALPFFALALAALGFIGLMLSFSQPLWDNISLLSFVQLPMRLRGLVALCLAPVISIAFLALSPRLQFVRWLYLTALVLFALPLLYPRYARDIPANPTLTNMFSYEQFSGAFGTTSFGEYLPVGVQNLPDKSPYADAYTQNQIPNRLVIPEGVTLCGTTLTPTVEKICTTSNDSWHAIYQSFYFPAWRITLDNQPLEISPTPRTGLITFTVPTSGTLRIEYAGTVIEHVADTISIASAILILAIAAYALRNRTQSPIPPPASAPPTRTAFRSRFSRPVYLSHFASFVFLALALCAFKLGYTDHFLNPFVSHFDGYIKVRLEDHPYPPANFQNTIELLDFDANAALIPNGVLPRFRVQRGQSLTTTLYLRALTPLQKNYSSFVHLTAKGEDGNANGGMVLAQEDNLHPAGLPTTRWELDGYVADKHTFTIPADLAAGEYELRAGIYDPVTNTRLSPASCCDNAILAHIRIE